MGQRSSSLVGWGGGEQAVGGGENHGTSELHGSCAVAAPKQCDNCLVGTGAGAGETHQRGGSRLLGLLTQVAQHLVHLRQLLRTDVLCVCRTNNVCWGGVCMNPAPAQAALRLLGDAGGIAAALRKQPGQGSSCWGQQLDGWAHSCCKIKPPWAEALAQRMQPRALQGDKTATESRHQPGPVRLGTALTRVPLLGAHHAQVRAQPRDPAAPAPHPAAHTHTCSGRNGVSRWPGQQPPGLRARRGPAGTGWSAAGSRGLPASLLSHAQPCKGTSQSGCVPSPPHHVPTRLAKPLAVSPGTAQPAGCCRSCGWH